jgi:hypothetical protein
MATANPAMSEAVYRRAGLAATPAQVMTVQGTVLKTALLLLILLVTAAYTWSQVVAGPTPLTLGLLIAGLLGGFLTALVTIFMPRVAPFTAPLYAALEGLPGHAGLDVPRNPAVVGQVEGQQPGLTHGDWPAAGSAGGRPHGTRSRPPSGPGAAMTRWTRRRAVLKGDELHGMIYFRKGDDSGFVAMTAEEQEGTKRT